MTKKNPYQTSSSPTPNATCIEVNFYQNEQGKILYHTRKFQEPDGKKKMAVYHMDNDDRERKGKRKGDPWVLFKLPELIQSTSPVYICEGEKDTNTVIRFGYSATTNPLGAGKWRDEFSVYLRDRDVIILTDNDDPGKAHSKSVALSNSKFAHSVKLLPPLPGVPEHGDITDWIEQGHTKEEFDEIVNRTLPLTWEQLQDIAIELKKDPSEYEETVDTSRFHELTPEDISRILGLTIARDDNNKLLVFLCMLCAYTEDSQFNEMFNSPSSTGKSYTASEVKDYFPKYDMVVLNHCTPKAFFYDRGFWDKAKREVVVDYSQKVVIFLDMPSP